jgi:hypothetical protein
VASLVASVVLLAAFAVIEIRSRHALLPLRLLRGRDRTGANLIMLCVGATIFGMFFFLTVFMQVVWGYSALRTGLAYLPLTAAILVASGAAAQLVSRIGARPLLLAGSPAVAGGLYWLSRISEHSSYAGGVLGPMLVTATGLGLLFVPLTLVAMSRVPEAEPGIASSLRTTGQQVGGSIGLALLGTVAWTVVANSIRASVAHATTAAGQGGHPARPSQAALTAIYHRDLSPRSGHRLLPRLPGRGRGHAARPGHHDRDDPGAARRAHRHHELTTNRTRPVASTRSSHGGKR